MTSFRLRVHLLVVAGLAARLPGALAADAPVPTPTPMPAVAVPAFAPVVAGCPDGCGSGATVGPLLGGFTGLGSAGTGIGLFAPNPRWKSRRQRIDGQNQPACAINNHPLTDWGYIRKFCGPTLIPGTCYGHFQTKWRRWEDHCQQTPTAPGVGCNTTLMPVISGLAPTYTPPAQLEPAPTPDLMAPRPIPKTQSDVKPPIEEPPMKPKMMESSLLINPPSPLPAIPNIPSVPTLK